MGVGGMNQRRRYFPSGENYTLAARITGQAPAEPEPAAAARKDAEKKEQKPAANLNVIAIADLDLIGEQFFAIRANQSDSSDLNFDNVPFVLNCVDVLAGDESFVSLRKKRPKHHTLRALETETSKFYEKLEVETKVAEEEARKELDAAQKDFDKQVDQVKNNTELDERSKEVQLENLQAVAQRRLDVKKAIIEDQKQARIRDSRADLEQNTREIQNNVRFKAAALPPLPPLLLGLAVWFVRRTRENLGANPKRLA